MRCCPESLSWVRRNTASPRDPMAHTVYESENPVSGASERRNGCSSNSLQGMQNPLVLVNVKANTGVPHRLHGIFSEVSGIRRTSGWETNLSVCAWLYRRQI